MPRSSRVAGWYGKTPLYQPAVEEAARRLASQRSAEVAQWSHSTEQASSELAQSDFEAFPPGCPSWERCRARGACMAALARELRVWKARNALKSK